MLKTSQKNPGWTFITFSCDILQRHVHTDRGTTIHVPNRIDSVYICYHNAGTMHYGHDFASQGVRVIFFFHMAASHVIADGSHF